MIRQCGPSSTLPSAIALGEWAGSTSRCRGCEQATAGSAIGDFAGLQVVCVVETRATVTLPGMTHEVEQLRAVLDGLRAGVLKKLAGLSEAEARRSTVGSGTNLAGLVQHLTFVESMWFEQIVAGGKATRGD